MNIRLEKIAKELLIDEDCVIIPEFGGFITHYRPALLEPNKNIILPPGKSVSFNAKLCKNDGLLAQNVALKTGLNYNDALKAIQLKVDFWEKELNKTKYLELDGFGSFVLNTEGNLVFEQFNETNFSNTSFGLTNVHASPIERVGLAQRIERGLDQKKAVGKRFKIIKASSLVASLLLLLYVGYQLDEKYSNDHLNLGFDSVLSNKKSSAEIKKDKNIDTKKETEPKQVVSVSAKNEIEYLNDSSQLQGPEKIEEINAEKVSIEEKKHKKNEVVNSSNAITEATVEPKFHVIAGCFGVESNATKMIQKLKNEGFTDARLTGKSKSGLLRVSYGSYHKKIVALKALAKAKLSHNVNAWLAKD